MDINYLDDIYLSLLGVLIPEAAVPWVPNMFATNSFCEGEYGLMRDAYARLCARLGVAPDGEDADLNCIVGALEQIQEVLCKEMFRLGIEYTAICRRDIPSSHV